MGGAYLVAATAAACFAAILLADAYADSNLGAGRYLRRISFAAGDVLRMAAKSRCVAFLLERRVTSCCIGYLRSYLSCRGVGLTAAETAVIVFLLVTAAMLGGAVLAASPAGAVVGFSASVAFMHAYAAHRRKAREQALAEEMPSVFRSLAVSLGSGFTLSQAIAYVGSRDGGEAARAFSRCSLRLTCGDSYEEALADLVGELDSPGIGLLSSALAISHQTGSPLHGLFMRSAELVERAGELERLLAVKTAQVRLSVRIVCLLPALLVCVLLMISPDFQAGVTTPTGIASIALAACMDIAAVLIVRSLSKGII